MIIHTCPLILERIPASCQEPPWPWTGTWTQTCQPSCRLGQNGEDFHRFSCLAAWKDIYERIKLMFFRISRIILFFHFKNVFTHKTVRKKSKACWHFNEMRLVVYFNINITCEHVFLLKRGFSSVLITLYICCVHSLLHS